MTFPSFLNCRVSSRWIHDFIADFRRQINVRYYCEDAVIFPNGVGLHWTGSDKARLPIKELTAIRPKKVRIRGWFNNRKRRKLLYWKPKKIPRTIALMSKLGWLSAEIKLDDIKENELLAACDEILKYGIIPLELQITRYEEIYSIRVSQHLLLSLVPTVHLFGCPSVDYSFILGNHKKIVMYPDNICTKSVNRMIKNVVACSVATEQVCIDFHWDGESPVFKEILEGLMPTLLWSKETEKDSILSENIKNFNPPPKFLYYLFHLLDGRIGVLRIHPTEYANIIFWVFPNHKELFKQLEESVFLYFED